MSTFKILLDWADTATESMKCEVRKYCHTLGYKLTLNTTDHRGFMLANTRDHYDEFAAELSGVATVYSVEAGQND